MWSGGRVTNELGESIILLQPVDILDNKNKYRNKTKTKNATNPSSSYVGGFPCYHINDILLSTPQNDAYRNIKCTRCDKPMHLLLQLHAPLDAVDRTLYVFGCNDASCHSGQSGETRDDTNINRFHPCIGSQMGGELRCVRSQQLWNSSETTPEMPNSSSTNDSDSLMEAPCDALEENDWGVDDGSDWGGDGEDDWGGATGTKDNISMDDLETVLTHCEMHSASKEREPESEMKLQSTSASATFKPPNLNRNVGDDPNDVPPSFEHHNLEMIDEPPSGRRNDDSDEDDDGGCSSIDASKVNQMLSRYLDMEDDDEIISALKGGSKSSSGGNKGGDGAAGGERDERLPPEERAFLAFSERLKRAPRQVARYAYGGTPLWSVPLPSKNAGKKQQRSKQQKSKKKAQKVYSPLPDVPPCICGAGRVFEFQVLPSILHVLDVDNAALPKDGDDMMDLISTGGMNWGSIAVYSCSESCDRSREEFIIVQEAAFEAPVKERTGTNGNSDNDDMDDD